ncbi:hypothetical protein KGY79_10060 [Candidatus Bipolaricaulota bacterium]|nr:hypothetical protein [Candidatus Bipolaricaulota bacterium]
MRKIAVILTILLLAFGASVAAEKDVKVPFSAIKSSCYDQIDMSKAEFPLSKVGKECVMEDWLEANLSKPSTEDSHTKGKTTKSVTDRLQEDQEWVIESGEEVIIEDVSIETPTDFIIKKGGSLIIRNCDLYMLGEHHHDNYFDVYGSLKIERSELAGEPSIDPYMKSLDPRASITLKNSNLGGENKGFHVALRQGGTIELEEVNYAGLSIYGNKAAVEEKGTVSANNSSIRNVAFRLGNIAGDFQFEGLQPNMDEFSFQLNNFAVKIKDSLIETITLENRGIKEEGGLNLRVMDSDIYGLTAWEGGNVVLEDTDTCGLTIKNRNYHEYHDLPQHGSFVDHTLVDEPNRRIRLIGSSVRGDHPHCPKNMQFGINLYSIWSDLKVIDSNLNELKVGRDLEAKNTTANFFQIYDNTGSLHFENSTVVMDVGLVISVNTSISGELTILRKEIDDWGGLKELSLTRKYPIRLLNKDGEPVEDTDIELLDPDGNKVNTVTTNSEGKAKVQIHFGKSNLRKTWTLQAPSKDLSKSIKLVSNTPVILSTDQNPPKPDPVTWKRRPHATSSKKIKMAAAIVTDPEGTEVKYYFEERTGNPNGDDSGWQKDNTYLDDNLQEGEKYCYRVKARDTSQNETGWSKEHCLVV